MIDDSNKNLEDFIKMTKTMTITNFHCRDENCNENGWLKQRQQKPWHICMTSQHS